MSVLCFIAPPAERDLIVDGSCQWGTPVTDFRSLHLALGRSRDEEARFVFDPACLCFCFRRNRGSQGLYQGCYCRRHRRKDGRPRQDRGGSRMRHRAPSRHEAVEGLNASTHGRGTSGRRLPAGTESSGQSVRSTRLLRIALVLSLAMNVLLVTAFWLYIHYAGTLSLIQDVVGFFE